MYKSLCSRHRWGLELKLLLKRLPLILLCVAVQFIHSAAANYAYLRHIQSEPLRDFGFELIPQIDGPPRDVSEHIALFIVASVFLWSFLLFCYNPPPVHWASVIVRVLFVMTLCTLVRCICFLSTGLPGPAPHCLPNSNSYNPPKTTHELLWRKEIFKGCGDLIFSSHTSLSMIFILAIQSYLYLVVNKWKYNIILYALYWPLFLIQELFIIASRKHYTVDIIVALYTTPFLWNLSYAMITDYQSQLTVLYKSMIEEEHDIVSTRSMTNIKIINTNRKINL